MDGGQMYRVPESGCCLFVPLFIFLSNFQTLKFFVTLFSRSVRRRRFKLGTHMDSGQMYRVYWNQAAAAYSSLYFFRFLSLKFSNIKIFCHTFLRNCVAYKVETWYTHGQWVDVIRLLLLIGLFISSFFFLSNFQSLKIFVTLFSGTVRPRRLKLGTQVDSGQMYHVYRNQAAAAYSSFYFFSFLSLQFSNLKNVCRGCCRFIVSLVFFLSNYQTLTIVTFFSGTVRPRKMKLGTHVEKGCMYCVYRN